MSEVLQIGQRTVALEELLPLLAGYQMLPQLYQEILIDQVISDIECTPEETAAAREQYYAQNQLTEPEVLKAWLAHYRMTVEQLEALTVRSLKVEKFKETTWDNKVESYFLGRKGQLDKVIYSLIRTPKDEGSNSSGIANELYFRILEGEQSFAELARTYSQGPEAQTDGLIGPVELSVPHPTLAKILSISKPGQLIPPTPIGDWIVIVRLEKFIPAQLDEAMRKRLLNEFFNNWLKEQIAQIAPTSPAQPPVSSSAS
jgi:parvulin-like peptidyl-prolyl isomerase